MSNETDDTITIAGLTVRPLQGAAFGAEVVGLDPGRISDEQKTTIWDLYRERHGLLCFSFGRVLDADEQHGLTAVFGENEFAPGMITGFGKGPVDGEEEHTVEQQVAELRARDVDPYLLLLGNIDPQTSETKKVDETFYGEWEWHSDMSYIEVPPTFSLLHSRIVPAVGGDTGFCSQVMAAAELPDDLRHRIEGREIKHDSTYGSSGLLRPGMTPPATPVEAIGHCHPVIRIVPTTGDEAIFLGRRTNGYVVGMGLGESERLLNELWAHATQERFSYRHQWDVGQVVVWDNRMLLHMRHPIEDDTVRFMWRTQTKGEAVLAAGGPTQGPS